MEGTYNEWTKMFSGKKSRFERPVKNQAFCLTFKMAVEIS